LTTVPARIGTLLLAIGMPAVACDDDEVRLEVTAVADKSTTSAANPVEVTVVATNAGDERVVWGVGSSGCQLSLRVRLDGMNVLAVEDRGCTDDVVEQGLDPGQTRSEVIPWIGLVDDGDQTILLDPGTYEVRGAAGDVAFSQPGEISVVVE
jgi:hypothetical protein